MQWVDVVQRLCAVGLSISAMPFAAAQDVPVARRASLMALEEIIITAQKREEGLLDVPMFVTALSGESLVDRGATTLQEIAGSIPGLSMLEYSPGQQRIQIRGISSATGAPVVGLYLDEMPINVDSVQAGADIRFIDLERIEVLHGPQGTLYGEGSMGGTIKYVTRDPDLSDASFGFDTSYGSVRDGSELYRGDFVANVPFIDNTFGMRVVGGYERSPGWADYPLIGGKNVNEGTSKTGRMKSLWKMSERWSASLLLSYQQSEYDSQMFADEEREAPYVVLQPWSDETRLANLVLKYDATEFILLSSTGYLDRTYSGAFDGTGFFEPIYTASPPFGFGLPPGSVQNVVLLGRSDHKILTQEIRITNFNSGRLRWTLGGYYQDYDQDATSGLRTTPNPLPVDVLAGVALRTSTQFAGFGELIYAFSYKFKTTLGLRYFRDEIETSGSSSNFGFATPEPGGEATFTTVNPRLVFAYQPVHDRMFYASAAKGFRSGGFNLLGVRPPGCNLPAGYDPEELWTYELGAHASLADGRGFVQVAVYHNVWNDIQTSEFCPGTQTVQTTNAGKASGTGVDVQLTLRLAEHLGITVSGGYVDAQYEEISASHLDGDHIDFVPEFTFGLSTDWDFSWSATLPGKFRVDYQHTDAFTVAQRNFPGPALSESDVIGRLSARLTMQAGKWEVALYGQNLLDENGAVSPPVGVILVPVSLQPRTLGIDVRYRY